MSLFDKIINQFSQRIVDTLWDRAQVQPILEARAYRQGYYKPQLKVKPGQFDDNLGLSYVGLIEARIVSQMFGKGIELDFEGEGEETEQETWIDACLDANQQEVLFHRAAVAAGEAGTGYLRIIPDGVVGKDGNTYPRLMLIDPSLIRMETLPEDYEVVIRYIYEYKFTGMDGKEWARRITFAHNAPDAAGLGGNSWTITSEISSAMTGGKWIVESVEPWPWDFAPILHWQNLPSAFDAYGEPDVTNSLREAQDRLNFLSSNISKLIRYYAHPMRYGVNVGEMQTVDIGPDKMVRLFGTDADLRQLEALGDLASSLAFFQLLEKAMFNTARVVDLASYEDKIGTLTNFGLRVLYQDNLAMIATKRELFGDMLEELVRRLLLLTGRQELDCEVVWPDFLPENEVEKMNAITAEVNLGILSKESAALELGIDWEQESERLDAEREQMMAQEDEIGGQLLRAFSGGQQGKRPF